MAKSMINDLTVGSVPGKLIRFSIPFILANFLQFLYNIVDMIIVGQKLGKVGLSAVSVGGDVTSFLTFVAMGFGNAGQIIISQYIGSGQKDKISRFIGTMMCFLLGSGAMISIICLLLRTPILSLMNTPPEAFS